MIESAFYLSRFRGSDNNRGPQKRTIGRYLSYRGYFYSQHLVSQFYTALKTKGFVILSGLTGTGKTKIAQELAELLDSSKNHLLFLSVRPDWRDSKALLGYYNPLTGEYHKTSLLEFILKALADYEKNRENAMPYFIILDEMNLAHVEYYFADFLSVFESGRDEDGFTKESIKLHDNEEVEIFQGIPKELKLPPNLYIVGTVNMDETTYSFSPKVLDRAFVVEFHDVELEEYPPERIKLSEEEVGKLRNAVLDDLRRDGGFLAVRKKGKDESEEGDIEKALNELKDANNGKYWEILKQLNKALEPYDLHFGYRVVDEIALFFQSAKESQDKGIVEFEADDEIFDLALLMKVLPKFHGNRKKLEEPLKAVLKLCLSESAGIDVQELRKENVIELLKNWESGKENFRFKHTARKVLRMLRQLYEIGFASFS
ncbi:McrB family protein [Thermococcus guaymasensis]|nr:AAA family ATPase [Thermococcus guaymasensis]